MNPSRIILEFGNNIIGLDGKPTFNVVIIHDGQGASTRAIELFSRLVEQFNHAFEFRCDLWHLDALELPYVRHATVRDIEGSHLMIVAARADAELTPEEKIWIAEWMATKPEGSGAVVALLQTSPAAEEKGQLREFLQTVAKAQAMELFVQEETHPTREVEQKTNRIPSPCEGVPNLGRRQSQQTSQN